MALCSPAGVESVTRLVLFVRSDDSAVLSFFIRQ